MAYGIPIGFPKRLTRSGTEPGLDAVRLLLTQALAIADEIDTTSSQLVACSISLAIEQLEDHGFGDGLS